MCVNRVGFGKMAGPAKGTDHRAPHWMSSSLHKKIKFCVPGVVEDVWAEDVWAGVRAKGCRQESRVNLSQVP